jgi:hypothetical protein
MRLINNPIANSKNTLIIFLGFIDLFLLTARGIAIPMINKKAGKTRSAQVNPFQSG